MRAVGHASQRRRIDLVPFPLQRIGDAAPAPAAVPGAVNQDEGFWRRLGFTPGASRRERAGGGERAKRSSARRFQRRRRHGNLLPICFYFRGITTLRRRAAETSRTETAAWHFWAWRDHAGASPAG